MKYLLNGLLFLLANSIGFLAAPLAYNIAVIAGWFDPSAIEKNPAEFQAAFFTGTSVTWLICMLASVGFFLMRDRLRFVFLLIPVVLPLAYGFKVLNGFAL